MPQDLDGLNIIITGDSSQAVEAIKKANDAMNSVKSSDVKITADASQATDETAKLADTVNNLDGAHVEITADSSQAVDAAEKVADAEAQISDAHSEITADSSQAVDEAQKASDALDSVGDAHSEITADASQAHDELNDIHDVIAELDGKKVTFTVTPIIRDINGRLHNIHGKFLNMGERAGEGFASGAQNGIDKVEKSINRLLMLEVGSKLEAGFGNIFKTIIAGAQKVAGAISGVVQNALAIGGGFEAQMTAVKVISGATEEELDALIKKAREMGATLPITAKDAAMAMTILAQRGTSVKDILASVTEVSNLAISQGVSMGAAADLLGSTLTNFGLSIDDAAKVTAIFNNASNQSALNMNKLTEALKYVAPTAGSVGMELTEAIAAMEALANSGLTGEMIGTGLTRVITKLATKTELMGVLTKDANGKLRNLADIFNELKEKGFSLAEANSLFGARGMLAALNIAKQSDTLKENEERLKQWGSTQSAVAEKSKTFTNNMAALRSAIEEIHIEIFDQIKDKAKTTVGGLTGIVRSLSEWVSNTKIAQKAWQAFLDGLGFNIPSGSDFKKFLDNIDVQALIDKVKGVGETIKSVANGIISFASMIKTPLLFLIKHLDLFATISFWGWILSKGMQIPAIIVSLATAFSQLGSALKVISTLNLSSLMSLLLTPTGSLTALTGFAVYAMKTRADFQAAAVKLREKDKEYLLEQYQADQRLDLDIKVNIKTGFEKLPESWTKASDEMRDKANATVAELQEAFKGKVGEAINSVIDKFPDMAQAFSDYAETINHSSLSKLTKALQGNKEAFTSLPPHMQLVAEHLYHMGVQAGQTEGSLRKIIQAQRDLQNQSISTPTAPLSEAQQFSAKISEAINAFLKAWNDNFEHLKKITGEQNLDIKVGFLLDNAHEQLKKLSKSIAKELNISPDIISSEIAVRLQDIADKGNSVTQSLVHGWDVANKSLDNFLANAKDAVTYLGVSPEKFSPALTKLSNSIQKIDPLTGKVTEQFKKAHDALKQWANVTFDHLTQRIQKLRKAVEEGFIDKKALKAEFEAASKQVKLKIAAELEPLRGQYQSEQAFNSVVASEYFSRMREIGGDTFLQLAQKEMAGFRNRIDSFVSTFTSTGENAKLKIERGMKLDGIKIFGDIKSSGNAIGQAIMQFTKKEMGATKLDTSPKTTSDTQFSSQLQGLQKVFTEAVNPVVAKLEQIGNKQDSSGNSYTSYLQNAVTALQKLTTSVDNSSGYIARANEALSSLANSISNIKLDSSGIGSSSFKDYSPDFANIIKELQNVSASGQATFNAVSTLANAVVSVDSTLKAQQQSSFDGNVISQAIISGLNPFFSRLDAHSSVYQSATADLTRSFSGLDSSFELLRKSTDANSNALTALQNSMASSSSGSGESFSGALAPLINSVQSLAVSVAGIQSINQDNATVISEISNAVRAVESAVKSINGGNTYNVDIHQEGFNVEKKSDADMLARSTASAFRSGIGNGGV